MENNSYKDMIIYKRTLSVTVVSLKRWLFSSKTLFGLLLIVIFSYVTYSPLNDVVQFYGVKASPWIFSFFLSFDRMLVVFAGILMVLYSDAFLVDAYSQSMIIRCGRRTFITGQILAVVFSGLVVTALAFVCSFVMVLPSISWDQDWGAIFYTMSEHLGEIIQKAGISISIVMEPVYLRTVSPITSTLMALLLMWMSSVFDGCLIGCLRVLTGKAYGTVVIGVLAFVSMFSRELGQLVFGSSLRYFSPVLWSNPLYLNWYGTEHEPTPAYAVCALAGCILVFCILSSIRFRHGDIYDQETGG